MKAKNIFLLIILTLLANCSWEEKPTLKKQTESSNTEDASYKANISRKLDSVSDSTNCYVQVMGRLIVNNGNTVDLASTHVTVKRVVIQTEVDNNDSTFTYFPVIANDVAEPDSAYEWKTFPIGVKYTPRILLSEPVCVTYKEKLNVIISVHYLLRTSDYSRVTDCKPDLYVCSGQCKPIGLKDEKLCIDIPLVLTTIQIGAIVEDVTDITYDQEN